MRRQQHSPERAVRGLLDVLRSAIQAPLLARIRIDVEPELGGNHDLLTDGGKSLGSSQTGARGLVPSVFGLSPLLPKPAPILGGLYPVGRRATPPVLASNPVNMLMGTLLEDILCDR